MAFRRLLTGVAFSAALLAPQGKNEVLAQTSVSGVCVSSSGSSCTLLRFLISAGIDPVALVDFTAVFTPSSSWVFTGALTGSFFAEDDFSFGVPYSGSTAISDGGLSLFIAFLSPATFELTPFGSGYLEVAVSGGGDSTFRWSGTDPDASVISQPSATLLDPYDHAIPPEPTVTPEPVTVVLLGSGLAGLAALKRRRRAKMNGVA